MKKLINRGFTLIELLVVIAIIGILASVVLVSLNSARDKGRDTRIVSNVTQARTQIEAEQAGTGYRAGTGLCVASIAAGGVTTLGGNCATLATDVTSNGGTLAVVVDTTSGTSFAAYRVSSALATDGQYYCVDSTGKTSQGTTAPTGTTCP